MLRESLVASLACLQYISERGKGHTVTGRQTPTIHTYQRKRVGGTLRGVHGARKPKTFCLTTRQYSIDSLNITQHMATTSVDSIYRFFSHVKFPF